MSQSPADTLPDVLTKEQLSELLQIPVRTLEDWRSRGRFASELERRALRGVKIGGHVRYSRKLVMELLDAGEQEAAA